MAAKQDKFVQALIGEPRLEPSMVKLRSATSTMNQYNLSEVTATANALLARLSHSDKPKTFSELLQRIRQVYPQPHADMLAIKGAGDDDSGLSALMALTSLEKPVPKAEAAALGLATEFKPKQYSTFYDPDASFAASLTLIFEVMTCALSMAEQWKELRVEGFRTYVRKAAKSKEHAMPRLQQDIEKIVEFLENGRQGWPLIDIPHNFFHDVIPLVMEFTDIMHRLRRLHEDLQKLDERFVGPGMKILEMLHQLRNRRIAEERKSEAMRQKKAAERAAWQKRTDKLTDGYISKLMDKSSLDGKSENTKVEQPKVDKKAKDQKATEQAMWQKRADNMADGYISRLMDKSSLDVKSEKAKVEDGGAKKTAPKSSSSDKK